MKKLASLFTVICVFNLLALVGLIGFLVATGRLDGPKASAITDLLRHKGTPDKFREQLYDILQPTTQPATAPASQTALASDGTPIDPNLLNTADQRLDYAQKTTEQERLRLEAQAQDLRHRQDLLVQLQSDVQSKLDKIAVAQKSFDDARALVNNKGVDENFQKSLTLYNELKTKQVKDLFMGMQPEDVAKFLVAMEPDRAAKIIGEFKSPVEAKMISTVLDRIRSGGTSSALGSASAATPLRSPGT